MHTRLGVAFAALALTCAPVVAAQAAPPQAAMSAGVTRFANCKALNATYPHGVAQRGARDRVKGRAKPATGFRVAAPVYAANRHLDRDHDGVACEKK